MFGPDDCLLVGVSEDEPDGSMRIYLGARYTHLHTHLSDPTEKENVRRIWNNGHNADHIFTNVPLDKRCTCPELDAVQAEQAEQPESENS
jgi:hypothetical protein